MASMHGDYAARLLLVVSDKGNRRRDRRKQTDGRIVYVANAEGEGLARCRNVSDGGMRLHLSMQVSLGERMMVAWAPGEYLEAEIVWTEGSECGVRFSERVYSSELLRVASAASADRRRRSTRAFRRDDTGLRVTQPLEPEPAERPPAAEDSGQDGFNPGLKVRVVMPDGHEEAGVVRWTKNRIAALMIDGSRAEPSQMLRMN